LPLPFAFTRLPLFLNLVSPENFALLQIFPPLPSPPFTTWPLSCLLSVWCLYVIIFACPSPHVEQQSGYCPITLLLDPGKAL
jgi:hypothetical protein